MSHPFDATLKEIVSQAPTDFQSAFRLPAAEPTTSRIAKDSTTKVFERVKIMHTKTLWDEFDEAMIKTTKRYLFSLGRQKFGEPEPKDEKALNRIKEFARLERMIDRIFEINSWKELLAVR
jgi:hypothetical protein